MKQKDQIEEFQDSPTIPQLLSVGGWESLVLPLLEGTSWAWFSFPWIAMDSLLWPRRELLRHKKVWV